MSSPFTPFVLSMILSACLQLDRLPQADEGNLASSPKDMPQRSAWTNIQDAAPPTKSASTLSIIYRPILLNKKRETLIREYRRRHYGAAHARVSITPRMIVVHCTGIDSFEKTFNLFYHPELSNRRDIRRVAPEQDELNVSTHYIVDKKGAAYQIQPATMMARHVIGLNYAAIGIENVGCEHGLNDLTEAQVETNVQLIRQLRSTFAGIRDIIGHFEYGRYRNTAMWLEVNKSYFNEKIDPGAWFMQRIRAKLQLPPLMTLGAN